MHNVIIELKKDISDATLNEVSKLINNALGNRATGIVKINTSSPYRFEFSGGAMQFRHMQVALMQLKNNELFKSAVASLEVK